MVEEQPDVPEAVAWRDETRRLNKSLGTAFLFRFWLPLPQSAFFRLGLLLLLLPPACAIAGFVLSWLDPVYDGAAWRFPLVCIGLMTGLAGLVAVLLLFAVVSFRRARVVTLRDDGMFVGGFCILRPYEARSVELVSTDEGLIASFRLVGGKLQVHLPPTIDPHRAIRVLTRYALMQTPS